MRWIKNVGYFLFPAVLLFVLDQWIKYLFINRAIDSHVVFSWFRLELVMNNGLAFGLLPGYGLIISLLGIIIFLYFVYRFYISIKSDWPVMIGLGLVGSGAISNLVDRIFYEGYVVDYINLTFYSVFNLADVGIVVGLFVVLISQFRTGEREES